MGVAGQAKIYPGIDIDVPMAQASTDKTNHAGRRRRPLRAAFGAGADGVVLSREYVEMWIANLSAAGETLREIFARQPPKLNRACFSDGHLVAKVF